MSPTVQTQLTRQLTNSYRPNHRAYRLFSITTWMMLVLNGLSAWILMENKMLPTYGIEHSSNGEEVSCWVPSEAGKEFAICWKDTAGQMTIQSSLTIDGIKCRGRLLRPSHLRSGEYSDGVVQEKGVDINANTMRAYTFEKQELTDDDAYLNKSVEIGQITVVLTEVSVGSEAPYYPVVSFPESRLVHERTKKGIEHGVRLGKDIGGLGNDPIRLINTTHIRTLATFIFRYRSLEFLIAKGIAPPIDSIQMAIPEGSDVNDLTLDVVPKVEHNSNTVIKPVQSNFSQKSRRTDNVRRETDIIDLTLDDVVPKAEHSNTKQPREVIDLTLI